MSTTDEHIEAGARVRAYAEVLEILRRPVPKEYLKSKQLKDRKEGRSTVLWFLPWYRAVTILDKYFVWRKEVIWSGQIGGECSIVCRVLILCDLDGAGRVEWIGRDGEGRCPLDKQGYGDQLSNAASMAFRRACANWGLARHLYEKSDPPPARVSSERTHRDDPAPDQQRASPSPSQRWVTWLGKVMARWDQAEPIRDAADHTAREHRIAHDLITRAVKVGLIREDEVWKPEEFGKPRVRDARKVWEAVHRIAGQDFDWVKLATQEYLKKHVTPEPAGAGAGRDPGGEG